MSLKNKLLLWPLVVMLAIFSIASILLVFKTNSLKSELDKANSEKDSLDIESKKLYLRMEADELFISGKHLEALEMYRDTLQTFVDASIIERRQNIMQRLGAIYEEIEQSAIQSSQKVNFLQDIMAKGIAEKEIFYTITIDSILQAHANEIASIEKRMAEKELKLNNIPKNSTLTFYSKNGTKTTYFGEVNNNKANGIGIGYYSTGNAYIGGWKDNLKHGKKSTFLWVDGDKYEGDYVNDKREGKGTYFWTNGDKYEGDWKDDRRNGFGILYDFENKIKLKGEWKNDEFTKSTN